MFEIDHGNMPKGDEYREFRQYVNSLELRNQVERSGCSSISIIKREYRDKRSGQKLQGFFITPKGKPKEPFLLIKDKKNSNALFKYEAVPVRSEDLVL